MKTAHYYFLVLKSMRWRRNCMDLLSSKIIEEILEQRK